ncbi:SLATT domain-containing protein [Rahnella sp. C60]|uniref:SLATT domain-containing protein n=1 Tax=Rahnella perminowiae TaxID=2816244 RepID=UPI001C265A9D|nr:SLATT domain-containing protein [Rahnella perminowiae]MBU9813407.1 SLATT domain-containing protein [Rahnella perminowiae]
MNDERNILEGQLRECYGRVVYSHKTHEKCADILMSKHDKIKLSQIVISALVTGGIVSTFFDNGHIGSLISVILSTTLLIINTYTKNYDFGELAQKHRQAGSDLWIIREEYLSLLTDIRVGDVSLETIRERRDNLVKELHAVYAGAPGTNYKAYTAAQKALQELEDMTFSDNEIDAFLPKELKRK